MDFQQLEVLEEKIKSMVSAMKALQAENETLTRKYAESEKNLNKLKSDVEKWSRSAKQHDSLQEEVDTLRKEREEIKNKLERLISHLEELEEKI